MKRYVIIYTLAYRLVLVLCLISISAACDVKQVLRPQTPIDQAERRWQQQGIASYQIEVLVIRSIWHAQSHQITIQDGVVVDQSASCIPAPMETGTCQVEPFQAAAYTVPGLFAKAGSQVQGSNKPWSEISFDPTYGFPSRISFNNPDIVDEDWTWRVTSFEVLP